MIAVDDDPDLLTMTVHVPVLDTPRLTLRALTPDDADDLLAIYGDPEVIRYANADLLTTLDQAREMIAYLSSRFVIRHMLRWAIIRQDAPGTVIGTCGYHAIMRDSADARGTISYDLARVHWGQGFMTEALRTMIGHGFDTLGFDRIEAETFADNMASARVLEKLGFVEEESLPDIRRWSLRKNRPANPAIRSNPLS